MTNALKNQAHSHLTPGPATRPAQKATPPRADSARTAAAAKSAPADPEIAKQDALQKQARNLVGQTFFGTLLKQMRDSPFKSELFNGGKGGEAFAGMYDQQLAQRMAQRSGGRLTRPLVNKYSPAAAAAYRKQKNAARSKMEGNDVAHAR